MNQKEKAAHYLSNLPDLLKEGANQLKKLFDEHGKEVVDDSTGAAGLIIKFFGKPLLDKYFEKLKAKKLEGFGFAIYLSAAFEQAEESIRSIQDDLLIYHNDKIIKKAKTGFDPESIQFDTGELVLIFKPKEHPAVEFVRSLYEKILSQLSIKDQIKNKFLRHFNDQIENKIKVGFGDDYTEHLKEVEENWLKENEINILESIRKNKKIGYAESEDLIYETTYAKWIPVQDFDQSDDDKEDELRPIRDLIKEYFENEEENIKKILFIVADFGKGKSVFLRQYAGQLATRYLQTGNGLFPVYFNLRDFGNPKYTYESKLGIISNYLEMDFGIKLENDYFKKKTFAFLLDGLDESGEITHKHIDYVIRSIYRIQRLDTERCRNNQIIITSRPIDEGLKENLTAYKPFILNVEEGIEIPYFINIYGFKKEQFNHWLANTLLKIKDLKAADFTGYIKEIIERIKIGKDNDLHSEFISKKIITESELRRPIFAYMLYQLISRNINFSSTGKIGIYLSFLNFLTSEAKHRDDRSYTIDFKQESKFRNILHATAALWNYQRQKNKQGILKKEEICQLIEETPMDGKASLEKYKEIKDFKFLSHSYFGKEGNSLHFQHQSFAEILLAEYYLKIFIKFALDDDNIETARIRLSIGKPTDQSVQFLTELLILLKESAQDVLNSEIIEKRRLLFPIMASLATKDYSKSLFCNHISYKWYLKSESPKNSNIIEDKILETWPIDQEAIEKIVVFSKKIIESSMHCRLMKGEQISSLYNKEVMATSTALSKLTPDIERWLALLVGNVLYNDDLKELFFSRKIDTIDYLFPMIKNWNYVYEQSAPIWGKSLFRGLNMENNQQKISLPNINAVGIDFSYSYFRNLLSDYANWSMCKFDYCTFENVAFKICNLNNSSFIEIKSIKGDFNLLRSTFAEGLILPDKLSFLLCKSDKVLLKTESQQMTGDIYDLKCYFTRSVPFPHTLATLVPTFQRLSGIPSAMQKFDRKQYISEIYQKAITDFFINSAFRTLEGFFLYFFKKNIANKEDIKSWFVFEDNSLEQLFDSYMEKRTPTDIS